MAERRTLTDGLKSKPEVDPGIEKGFVYQEKQGPAAVPPNGQAAPEALPGRQALARVPFTTRIRADMAQALKRASLERQLQGVEPNTVQDILEEAVSPWLRTHGYLS